MDIKKEEYFKKEVYLGGGDEVTYNLRLWMDEDVTMNDTDSMNQTFEAKVVVTATIGSYSPVEQGFTTLADAMLVNEYQSSSVEDAKAMITAKQAPDFTKTAPIVIWSEEHASTTDEISTNASMYIGTSYEFNSEIGNYTILNYGEPRLYTDISNEEYMANDYYTCVGNLTYNTEGIPNYWRPTECTTMYKILNAEEYQDENETRWRITAYAYTQNERESDSSDRGLYIGEDDYGETYYYRGNVKNNNVLFGGYYWKIIRLNGDGSVRLLYNGTAPDITGTLSTPVIGSFNQKNDSPAYIGYMYGNTINQSYEQNIANEVDSTIKKTLDSWYEENIVTNNLESYIADPGFCNDRSLATNSNNGDGVSLTQRTTYQANIRINNSTPSFKCPSQNDLFTVTNEKGNQNLSYSISTITADELVYAGMSSGYINRSFYAYTRDVFYTLSPSHFDNNTRIFTHSSNGQLLNTSSTSVVNIRPVINLLGTVEISGGIGTASNPYQVKTE